MMPLAFHPHGETTGGLSPRCWLLRLLAIAVVLGIALRADAQGTSADEYEIRAAMLMNLTRYIEWPASKLDASHAQFLVCILGPDPIEPYADRYLKNQSAGGKAVQVLHISSLDTAGSCHILYIGAGWQKGVQHALPDLVKNSVLTISERSNASSPGQVIGLPSVEEHVHIDVNLGAAQRSGISISSKLLRLATVTP